MQMAWKAGEVRGWPEGLTDEEAMQRFQTLCLAACDGVQDLAEDARYKALRRALMARPDLRPMAPAFVAAQPGLEALVRHLRETPDRAARRDMVRAQFGPLRAKVQGEQSIASSGWTGRPDMQERAALVRKLAPVALEAVARLLEDEERLRSNGGPVDPDREEALSHLKALHRALGELIDLARADLPLEGVLGRLQTLRREAKMALGRAAATLPVTASTLVAFGSVVGISEFFVGNVVVSVAAGGLAGNTVKDALLRREAKPGA